MPVTSITFVKEGLEPKQIRATKTNEKIQKILAALKSWPAGENMVINLDGKKKHEAYALARRLKTGRELDQKKFNIYRAGNQVVVRKTQKT